MTRLPLDLFAEVETASGERYQWDANQPAASRLQSFTYGTKIGEGFSQGSGQLSRRIDRDYPDLGLGQTLRFCGADGTIAYEGRVEALPRQLDTTHSIAVTLAGWMTAAKRRKFTEIYADRGLGWMPPGRGRRATQLAANGVLFDPEQTVDDTDSQAGVTTAITGAWSSPYVPTSEAWYDAGEGNLIGSIMYQWRRQGTTIDNTLAAWNWTVAVLDDDKGTNSQTAGNLRAAGPSALSTFTPTVSYRYAHFALWNTATPSGADGARYAIDWYKPAVYGTHGLQGYFDDTAEPAGLYASDIMRDIVTRFCPKLDPSGIQQTNLVIHHCAFKDRTFPYEAFLELNKYHLWHLGVWENRRLDFRPYDLTDYKWEVRTDDPGVTVSWAGETTDQLFNGIAVEYDDLNTGTHRTLTPETHPELLDTSFDNIWNQYGDETWDELPLTSPTVEADALQLGRAALAERNTPKHAGTITVKGYVRDRAGNEQPAWKIRAGDVIRVADFNEVNRLIVETTWDDDSKTATLAIDFPLQTLEVLFDRLQNEALARGLVSG